MVRYKNPGGCGGNRMAAVRGRENEKTTTFILVRHGECTGNKEGLFRGRKDFPLTEKGLDQAKRLADALSSFKIDLIYSSPLSRATETARAIAERCGLSFETREGFVDMALGPWEGISEQKIAEEYPVEWTLWLHHPERLRLPQAETLSDVQRRGYSNIEHLAHLHTGKKIVIVTHRSVIKTTLAACLGIADPYFWRVHTDPGSYSKLEHRSERGYCLTLLNQTCHMA